MKKALLLMITVVMTLAAAGCTSEKESAYSPDYLVLVNKEQLVAPDYTDKIELVDLENVDGGTYQAEKGAVKAYHELHDALLEKGVEIGVDSAYRSVEAQQEIMDEFIRDYGEEYAKATVAVPGSSEHHTGLAIDIVPKAGGKWVIENEDMLKETEIFALIHEALPEYGFIVRYPQGKEAITGYGYEPWHIRYVGKEAAREIYSLGVSLEEYLAR